MFNPLFFLSVGKVFIRNETTIVVLYTMFLYLNLATSGTVLTLYFTGCKMPFHCEIRHLTIIVRLVKPKNCGKKS